MRRSIISIEDGLAEGDWPGWARLTNRSAIACSWWATMSSYQSRHPQAL